MALFIWLKVGIEVNTFKVSNYHVDGLYIKLDKKLILKADKVTIPKRKANPSLERMKKTLSSVKYLLTFFDTISLKEIHFNNNTLGINFHDSILQLSSNDYLIRGNVSREGNIIRGNIPMFRLKNHDITMRGEFTYNFDKDILTTEGKFLFQKSSGYFRANKVKKEIDFTLKSNQFSDLRSIIDTFNISTTVKSWIVDKIQAKSYKLHALTGKGRIENNIFDLELGTLKANATLYEASIDFKEGLPAILADSIDIVYTDNKGLLFDLDSPRYLGKNLDGSKVSIVHLRDDNTTLKLNLKFDTRFDNEVKKILDAYGVNIPLIQRSGTVYASLDMNIGLKNNLFELSNDVTLRKGKLDINGLVLPIEEGKLYFKEGLLKLNDIKVYSPEYQGTLSGTLNVVKHQADLLFDAKKIEFKENSKTIFSLKNEKIPFELNYANNLEIQIPKFTLGATYDKKTMLITISNLYRMKAYFDDSMMIEEGGSIEILTKNFKDYTFKGLLKRNSCFLYESNDECKTRVSFRGKATKDNVHFYAFKDRFYFNKAKSRLEIKNLNIDLEKFLGYEKNTKAQSKTKKDHNFVILGTNSQLRYSKYKLVTDSYDVEVSANGDIKAIGSNDGDIIKFTKTKQKLSIQALRIKDNALHPLINFDGLQNGRYSITQKGEPKKLMHGEIIIEGGVMKNFKAYNNTVAFINTLPALVTLQKPGYSDEGFVIESGVIEYRIVNNNKIIFDSIYIKGESATIAGKGEINLKNKSINIELGIQVAREFGNAVGSIPLVGYILVGENKNITVGLNIKGSLDEPLVNVSAAEDILAYPLELIKRTIETPIKALTPKSSK